MLGQIFPDAFAASPCSVSVSESDDTADAASLGTRAGGRAGGRVHCHCWWDKLWFIEDVKSERVAGGWNGWGLSIADRSE